MKKLLDKLSKLNLKKKILQVEIDQVEKEILSHLELKEEGAKTFHESGYNITATTKINRTLDKEKWAEIEKNIPKKLRPVKYEAKLEIKGLRYLQEHEPGIYAIAAEAITAKPGKTALKIEKE